MVMSCDSHSRGQQQQVHKVTLGLVGVQWLKEEFYFVKRSRFAMEAERVHLDEKFEFVSS